MEPSWAAWAGRSSGAFRTSSALAFESTRFGSVGPLTAYQEEVRVGAVLPSSGVTYYEVPAEYGVRDYRYTVVNDRRVLVDPRTHRVIQIVE